MCILIYRYIYVLQLLQLCVKVVYAVISSCSNSMQFWCHQWSDFFATDTGVYATSEFAHITAKMLDKYKDQVRELKSKDEIITALLDPHCKEILAFAGSNGTTDWEGIFKETESRAFPTTDSPKITRVIFSDSDPAEGQCVETGRVKFVYFVGKPDEPDILEKLMMKGDLPVFKKDSHQRYPSSDATLLTQDSRNTIIPHRSMKRNALCT